MFFKRPGKICGTTLDQWRRIIAKRLNISAEAADAEVAAMMADGRLIQSAH